MIINGETLICASPIHRMARTKLVDFGLTYGLGEAGYDIRINQDIVFQRDFFFRRSIDRTEYNEVGEVLRHERFKGKFVLASTIERFRMPPNLMGVVHDKSTWARRGLSVFSTVIEPGWSGHLTLELVYHGQEDLVISAGSGIAQVVFHQLANRAEYKGRYQDQANEPVEAIEAE
jgi:dCTP deaminase